LRTLGQLGKDTLIYGLGGAIAKGLSFFLLPVYTRIFSPAEYGELEMLAIVAALISSVMVMGMDSAQSFYFFEQRDKGQDAQASVVTAIVQWRLAWGAGCVLLATLLSPLLNTALFSDQLDWRYFAVAFSGSLFAQLTGQCAQVFRLLYRPARYLALTLTHTLLSAAVALTLILVFDQGILGFFLGGLVASVLAALLGWWSIRGYLDWSRWHRKWWPRLVRFGGPLVPAGFAMYILSSSDRWFITTFRDAEELGLYAVGAKFALMIGLAVQTFRLAWWPAAMEAMQEEAGKELFRTIGRGYMAAGVCGVVLLTALAPLLVRLLAAPAFADAHPVVGVLGWYPVFYGFYLVAAAGLWKAEKTAWAPVLMLVAAGLNLGLNYLWVPTYGGIGAAAATSVSFFVWIALALIVSERLWKVGYPYALLFGQVGLGVAASVGILWIYRDGVDYAYGLGIAAAAIPLLAASAPSRSHRRQLWRKLIRRVDD
jgi:O-antigen/teichoic acid export membrane protein